MNCKITLNHTSIYVDNYSIGDSEKLEKRLSVWDAVYHRMRPTGFMYDEDKQRLLLPRGMDINYVEKLIGVEANINYTPDPYDTMSIRVRTTPKNDRQRKSIAYLIGEEDFKYTKKYSQLLLNLPTGEGKTYVTLASLQFLGTKAIIITPTDKIKQQWHDTFTSMSDVTDSMICNVSGSSVFNKLMKSNSLQYKIYIVNHSAINAYAKKEGWDAVHEFFEHIRVGVKIYDEAHLNFENIMRIDLHSNTKKTFYLTATFERSDYLENFVFKTCFKNIIKYGFEAREEIRKHMMYLGIMYNSKPSLGIQSHMVTQTGFNKNRYAEYQKTCPEFYDALEYVIKFFKQKEGKMLILSTTIDLVDNITEHINKVFDDVSVKSYHSKIDADTKALALESDIISSTPKSMGTGVDIVGLRTVIMCEAYSSTVQADQVSGRLREYNDTLETFYVELVDVGFTRVHNMYKRRLPVFKQKCKKILTVDISKS